MTTQQELATRLGLSVATVSLALTGRGRISPATRERVMKEAQRAGYRVDASARAIRTGRTGLIGLLQVLPENLAPMSRALFRGIVDGLLAGEATAMLAAVQQDAPGNADQLPPMLRQRQCDGFLVNHHQPPTRYLGRILGGAGVPVVWMNNRLEKNAVFIDDEDGAYRMTRMLIAAGQRRLGYMDYHHPQDWPERSHYSVRDRRAGFRRACTEAGLEPRLLIPPQRLDDAAARDFTRAWMGSAEPPTTVLTYGGGRDAQLLLVTAAELGRRVPEDIGVVQFGDDPHLAGMAIDTVQLPFELVGQRAAAMVLRCISEDAPEAAEALACGLCTGRTTILPPAGA